MALIPNSAGDPTSSPLLSRRLGSLRGNFSSVIVNVPPPSGSSNEVSQFATARFDWKETPEAHVFKADLPGLKKEEVKVEVEDGMILQISSERRKQQEEKNDKWHRVERSSGKFTIGRRISKMEFQIQNLPESSNSGGVSGWWQQRLQSIKDGVFKVNQHTFCTNEGKAKRGRFGFTFF